MFVLLNVQHPEGVTGWQRTGLGISRRPCGHDQAPALGPCFEFVNDVADLVVEGGFAVFVHGKVPPEVPVSAWDKPILVSPRFPEAATVFSQKINAGIS